MGEFPFKAQYTYINDECTNADYQFNSNVKMIYTIKVQAGDGSAFYGGNDGRIDMKGPGIYQLTSDNGLRIEAGRPPTPTCFNEIYGCIIATPP